MHRTCTLTGCSTVNPETTFRFNMMAHSLSTNSCGVKKSACLRIVCACRKRNLPWSGFRVQKYTLRHSNTVFSLVKLIMWLLRTNKSTTLLWRRIHFRALEPLHGIFLFIQAEKILRQTDLLTPQQLFFFYLFRSKNYVILNRYINMKK